MQRQPLSSLAIPLCFQHNLNIFHRGTGSSLEMNIFPSTKFKIQTSYILLNLLKLKGKRKQSNKCHLVDCLEIVLFCFRVPQLIITNVYKVLNNQNVTVT